MLAEIFVEIRVIRKSELKLKIKNKRERKMITKKNKEIGFKSLKEGLNLNSFYGENKK